MGSGRGRRRQRRAPRASLSRSGSSDRGARARPRSEQPRRGLPHLTSRCGSSTADHPLTLASRVAAPPATSRARARYSGRSRAACPRVTAGSAFRSSATGASRRPTRAASTRSVRPRRCRTARPCRAVAAPRGDAAITTASGISDARSRTPPTPVPAATTIRRTFAGAWWPYHVTGPKTAPRAASAAPARTTASPTSSAASAPVGWPRRAMAACGSRPATRGLTAGTRTHGACPPRTPRPCSPSACRAPRCDRPTQGP